MFKEVHKKMFYYTNFFHTFTTFSYNTLEIPQYEFYFVTFHSRAVDQKLQKRLR